jgi:hypothetical protein
MRFEHSGATGGIVEEELFGKSQYEGVTHLDYSDYKYITWRGSFDMLKEMQPSDPTEPAPDFANTVHYYIFEGLGIDASDLKFFTAVKSPLDKFHGIDGWFEIGEGRNLKRVTVDITLNENKDEHKADIVFLIPNGGLDRKVDKEQFLEYAQALSNRVVEFFKKQ